jgi:hypothetical protein
MSLPTGRRAIRSIISGNHRFPYLATTTAASIHYLRRAGFLILPVNLAPDLQMPGVEYFASTLYFRMVIE